MKHLVGLLIVFMLLGTGKVFAEVDYTLWAGVLNKYVDEQGRVDYAGLMTNRRELDAFIGSLNRVDVSTLGEVDRMAFWINAYNALTVQLILDNYPVKSIRSIWRAWSIPHKIAQGQYTLSDIEHKILRPLGDPRIHFAINCASIGCPQLLGKPFLPRQLNEQLTREAARFINDPEKVRLDKERNVLYLSAIFKWFAEDFEKSAGSVVNFVKKYVKPEDRAFLENNKISIKTLKYDWGLNDQSR